MSEGEKRKAKESKRTREERCGSRMEGEEERTVKARKRYGKGAKIVGDRERGEKTKAPKMRVEKGRENEAERGS